MVESQPRAQPPIDAGETSCYVSGVRNENGVVAESAAKVQNSVIVPIEEQMKRLRQLLIRSHLLSDAIRSFTTW